ncbi:adenylate/guanylate cyclase domain-containing protein [Synechococcus sp. RSCCF101]|uniref:adenylate/guanylate cyclase domain-containing protein n=1 Tax=Synechococcus sp. RSCCF101 TaxID=2511069 RepID=UPI0012493BF9|nr:adenylate/guanylate cyclase domain-containing protein [Synechococcus sp. RSCCF101]QEY32780.1 adenylate/guanylate cyclase domain-containing protein [Synechococcus sp. RSCCF101]
MTGAGGSRTGALWGLLLVLPLLAGLPRLAGLPPGRLLRSLDQDLRSLAFRLRGPRPIPDDLLILAIDSESLALPALMEEADREASPLWSRMGPWPWPRALQADLAVHALERGAEQVVFNIVLAVPSSFGPEDDLAFQARLAPWRDRVVLAASYDRIEEAGVEQGRLLRPFLAWPRVGLSTLLQTARGQAEAIPGDLWLEEQLGSFSPPRPEALAFVAARRASSRTPLGINFPGPAWDWPQIPAWQVPEQPDALWQGRTVVFGATAPELGDQQETPFGPMSGTLVQAAALATVMAGDGSRPAPEPLVTVLLLGWLLLCGTALHRSRSTAAVVRSTGLLLALAVLLGVVAWSGFRRWTPLAAALVAPLAGGGCKAALAWRRESRERAYLHQVLARRISPNLLRTILRDPGPLGTQLGGQRTRCVVLFTDLVGFTPLSARLAADELFVLLNRYFEGLAAAVLAEDGLLDKFIGDALMAEFGVPRSRGDREEALAAVRAALAMQRSLEALNRQLDEQGQPTLRQGIGLHVGEVIAGNLGSSQRLEFTVIGAAVNVASRLEGLTRRFPEHPILISGELRELLGAAVQVTPLGAHPVKGWPEPVAVFGLEGLNEQG